MATTRRALRVAFEPMTDSTLDRPEKRRCKAHSSRTGEPCKLPPLKGMEVCRSHGGAAKQCKRAAQRRIDEAADRMARELLGIAKTAESEAVKLAAVKDALDRAGLSPKHAVELEVSTAPWQEVLPGVARISQDESRARRGLQPDPTPALPPADPDAVVDAEVVEPSENRPPWPKPPYGPGADEPIRPPTDSPVAAHRPGKALMTIEEAEAAERHRLFAETARRERDRGQTRRDRF